MSSTAMEHRYEKASRSLNQHSTDGVDDETYSKSSLEDGLECPLCCEGFNSGQHLPYVLWCGHSLCKRCLLDLQWATVRLPAVPVQLPLFVTCPWCQFLSCRLVWKGNLKYPCKNFFLLWLVEAVRDYTRHGGSVEDKPAASAPQQQHQSHVGALEPSSLQHQISDLSLLSQRDISHVFFLKRWLKKMVGFCAQLMAKFMLLLLVLFILFCILPFSMLILVVYFAATLFFAFPSFLVVYFALPSVGWLLREILT